MKKTDAIVKKSGVSRSTVFRFFRGDNVRPGAKKAILRAMEELGCKTEDLMQFHDLVFEISVAEDFSRFKGFTEVIQGVTERAKERHIKIQLVTRTGEQIQKDYEKWTEYKGADGIIIIGKDDESETKERRILTDKKIPHLFVNRIFKEPDVSYVAVDVRKAACELVDFLIQKGHRKIAALGYPEMLRIDRDKLNGFYDAFKKNGIQPNPHYVFSLQKGDSSDETIDRIINMTDRPTAFFGICDSYAMHFINRAQSSGFHVPQDYTVAGMDDLEIAQYYKPSLTTVRTPFKQMGMLAVDSLFQMIANDLSSIRIIVSHQMFVRESTM